MIRTAAIALIVASLFVLACSTTSETEATPAPEPTVQAPPPPPEPARPVSQPVRTPEPIELPKTASPLPLVGLSGLAALGLGGVIRITRRRLADRI